MSDTSTAAIFGAVVGVLATLLTIYLTPQLQHRFWKRQRLAELRFEATQEVNRLLADFISEYIAHEDDPQFRPSLEFFKTFQVETAHVQALFSAKTWDAFKEVEIMVGPRLGASGGGAVDQFIRARDKALRAMYTEIGLELPPAKKG